jgi:superfamily I DNA and/or RNA helicase
LYDLSSRNPLINSLVNKLWFVDISDNNAEKVYKKQLFFNREYGLQTTILVSHFIKWKSVKNGKFYTSPLIYQLVKVIKNQKISLSYEYQIETDTIAVNPILKNEFLKVFDIQLDLINKDIECFLKELKLKLELNGDKIKLLDEWNDIDEWQIISSNAIGNFNYKKSVLGKDYDYLLNNPNQSICELLDGEVQKSPNNYVIELPNSDNSQKEGITKAMDCNMVIQGPPGTGKSHTIVELIKQNLRLGKKVLFVSEKRSALDVVFEKLKAQDLIHLAAYFNSEKNQKKEFYANLKLAIEKDNRLVDQTQILDFKINELEEYFKLYSQGLTHKEDESDMSIIDLVGYLAEYQVLELEYNAQYKIPNHKQWSKYLQFLEEIEEIGSSDFGVKDISQLPFLGLNKSVFIENNPLSKIEKRLHELLVWIDEVDQMLEKYNLKWTWSELSKYCLSASVLNMANKSQLDILDPKTKQSKSFDIWSKKYELAKNKLELNSKLCSNWLIIPDLGEIDELLSQIDQKREKWWKFFFKKSKVSLVFSHYDGILSADLKGEALKNIKENYFLRASLSELEIKLKHNLNILNPEIDINYLFQLRQKLNTLSSNQYITLLEHENSLNLIEELHGLQIQIQKSNQIIKFLFVDFEIGSLKSISAKINELRKNTPKFSHHLPEIKKTVNLPIEILDFIKSNALRVEDLTKIVMYHSYLDKVRFQPTLKNIESIDILVNFKALKRLKSLKDDEIINEIKINKFKDLQNTEKLLNTPASKLTVEQKQDKKSARRSKNVIFHEISKKQQHLPIKELVKQTSYSIFNIQPLWIMNPLSIAENLPCDANLFDLIIFDESSQIPLEDAIPAIYRSKQVVVVGDSNQMPPSQFFSSSTESVTLLNQATSVFNSHLLTWHYRSEHPRLMQFSNEHFYDNELSYFPSVSEQNPSELYKVENGVFENGKNVIEAKITADKYALIYNSGIFNVGIIAFSREQQNQIEVEIHKLNLPINLDLLITNLENAQGVERDVILISIGYGFNPEGIFRMNFGPINQDYGANRLNVLLTRAKQKMIVITSVHSTDFKLSANRGVQLLQDFIGFAEGESNPKHHYPVNFIHYQVKNILTDLHVKYYPALNGLAVNCFVQHNTGKILLIDPSLNSNENDDLFTILSVIEDRFKSVKVLLSHDYWRNIERFTKEVRRYFDVN